MAEHKICAHCKGEFPAKEIQADHILPVVDPSTGFIDWNTFIDRIAVDVDGYQALCLVCHLDIKTKQEIVIRKESKSLRVKYPREEIVYRNMLQRCYNPKSTGYEYYGGRGIQVCDRWKDSFYNFYTDMGKRPPEKTLDRINVYGDYGPSNCRWASSIEQGRNTTANNFINYGDEFYCIEEWAEKLGIKANTILYRLRRGWSIEEALEKVARTKKVYNGRLSVEDIEDLVEAISSGITQTAYGKKIDMDASQVNRIYHKFKEENKQRKENAKK